MDWGPADSFRDLVNDHHGRKHDSRHGRNGAGKVVEGYILILRQSERLGLA